MSKAPQRKAKISQAEQSKRFVEAAKKAGADEKSGTLEKVLRKIGKTSDKAED